MLDQRQRLRGRPTVSWRLAGGVFLLGLMLSPLAAAQEASAPPNIPELTARSLDLVRQGECRQAIPLMEQILEQQPKNVNIKKLLGECLLRQNRWDDARKQFEGVLEISPHDAAALQALQRAMEGLQRVEQVRQTLEIETRAVTADQLRAKYEFDRAGEFLKAGRLGEAEKILKDIVERQPDSVTARQRLAEIYTATNRYDQAVALYRDLASEPGAAVIFQHRLAQNLEWGGNYGEAAEQYGLYLEKRPDDLVARMALGNILQWAGRYQDAIAEYEHVLGKMPNNIRAQLAIAQCHEQLEQFELALENYEKALELDPTSPQAQEARDKYTQYFNELPRKKAYAALQDGDLNAAAEHFTEYLAKNPEDKETTLQLARVYSWAERHPEARQYYGRYLQWEPGDAAVRREVAQMELWSGNYAEARKHYEQLVLSLNATAADYEALVHAYLWDRDLEGAQPYARKLAELDPGNPVAHQAMRDFAEQRRYQARSNADDLVAAGRYAEAIQAYRGYMETYGSDRELEILVCRIYSWAREFEGASACYQAYLQENPQDVAARLELANMENWTGRYYTAETHYRAVLQEQPSNTEALLGVAQVMDYRGEDPIKVKDAFDQVLEVDPANPVAQQRAEEIRPLVAPALTYAHNSFTDTDGLYWSVNRVEATLTFPNRLRLTPFWAGNFFRQRRDVLGSSPEIATLNQRIAAEDGSIFGTGGGVRVEMTPSQRWHWLAEVSGINYNSGRSSLNVRGELRYQVVRGHTLGLSYMRRDAIHDLWTVATLAAGMMGDTVLASYDGNLGRGWRLFAAGGITRFDRGTNAQFASNTLRRATLLVNYQVHPSLTMGYVFRLSSFTGETPLHFSPELYQVHGFSYGVDHHITENVRLLVPGEINYSRIDGIDNFETSVAPRLALQLGSHLDLQVGYRFSLSRASAFDIDQYRTQGGEVRLNIIF